MLRITHVISDTNIGGAGIQLAYLCEALRNIFDLEIMVPQGSALLTRLPKEEVKITPFAFASQNRPSWKDVRRFEEYFCRTAPDIVHTHAAVSARIGAWAAGTKVRLSTRHCALSGASPWSANYRMLYNKCTTLTVATAQAAARDLAIQGVPPHRILTLRNGTPPTRRTSEKEQASLRRALQLLPSDTVIGCCGRLTHVKGQDLLLRAAARLLPRYPSLRILLIGDGDSRGALEALAARLGIQRYVRFTGYVADTAPYQNLFTLHVNPSRGTETSCLAITECMSLGIPTVASDFGGNPDMLENGKTGMLFRRDDVFSLAQTLDRLLGPNSCLSDMRAPAHRRYEEHFTLAAMANAYMRLYSSFNG